MGRKDESEDGFRVFGIGRIIECFQEVRKMEVDSTVFKIWRRGSKQLGRQRRSILPEMSKGPEDVRRMCLRILNNSRGKISKKLKFLTTDGREEDRRDSSSGE